MIPRRKARGCATLGDMVDKPGKYWDHDDCRWVKYAAPNTAETPVPEQAKSVEETAVVNQVEADVRSG